MSPENAEQSNLHRLLAMRLLGIARTASKLAKWLRFLERAKGFEPLDPDFGKVVRAQNETNPPCAS